MSEFCSLLTVLRCNSSPRLHYKHSKTGTQLKQRFPRSFVPSTWNRIKNGNLCVTGKSAFFPVFSKLMAMICWNSTQYSCGEHEQQYIVCVSSLPAHVLLQVCVCVRACLRGTCFSTAEWECLWPGPSPFCSHEVQSAAACLSCLLVCQWECTFHTCDHSRGGRASKLLCGT